MACGRNAIFLFAVLAIAAVKAEEGSGTEQPNDQTGEEHHDRYSINIPFFSSNMGTGNGELPSFSQLFGGGLNGTGNPFASFLGAFSQFLPNNNNNGSRQEEVQHDDTQHDQDHQDRLFFGSFFGVPATCNYTRTPGLSCAGCRERLTCYPGNTGRIRVCSHFFAPYCNNGRCSRFPGSACFSSSSSATTSGTTATTSGTTTT